jgi:hypothetical protein
MVAAAFGNGVLSFLNITAAGEAKRTFGSATGFVAIMTPALLTTFVGFFGYAAVTTIVTVVKARRRPGPRDKFLQTLHAGSSLREWLRDQVYGQTFMSAAYTAATLIVEGKPVEGQALFAELDEVEDAWANGHAKSTRIRHAVRVVLSCVPPAVAAGIVTLTTSTHLFASTGPLTAAFGFWWFLSFAMGRLGARKKVDITRGENISTTIFMLVAVSGLAASAASAVPSQAVLSALLVACICIANAIGAYAFGSIRAHPPQERAPFKVLAVITTTIVVGLPFVAAALGMRVWPILGMIAAAAFYGIRQWPLRLMKDKNPKDPIAVPSLGRALVYSWGGVLVLGGLLVLLHLVTLTPFQWFGDYPPLGVGSAITLPIILAAMGFGQHSLSDAIGAARFNPSALNGFAQLVGATVVFILDGLQGHPPLASQLIATGLVGAATVGLAIVVYFRESKPSARGRRQPRRARHRHRRRPGP